MKTSIYIPDDKQELFECAKTELGDSISATFLRCLERELEAKRAQFGKLTIDLYDPQTERRTKKVFEGRWLIGREVNREVLEGETYSFDYEATGIQGTAVYAVAQTAKKRIVVVELDEETG